MTTADIFSELKSTRSRVAKPAARTRTIQRNDSALRSMRARTRITRRRNPPGEINVAQRRPTHQPRLTQSTSENQPPMKNQLLKVSNGPKVNQQLLEHESLRDWARYLGPQHPLRLIFIGHNPSDRSWDQCAPYAHGSNLFWKLLAESNLAPQSLCQPTSFLALPMTVGIGFIDLFVTRGSDARVIERSYQKSPRWREDFVERILNGTHNNPPMILACVSKIVANQLLPKWKGAYGFVGFGANWNLRGLDQVEIWVIPSTSARAAISYEKRLKPFVALKSRLDRDSPWKLAN